jgi:predicted nucleic acid binding AN1-type Zn finger protein
MRSTKSQNLELSSEMTLFKKQIAKHKNIFYLLFLMYYMKSASYEYRKYSAKIETQWAKTIEKRDNFENRVVFTKQYLSLPGTDICIFVGHSLVMKQS